MGEETCHSTKIYGVVARQSFGGLSERQEIP